MKNKTNETTLEANQSTTPETAQDSVNSGSPETNPTQAVETNAYVPTYKIKPEFKPALLKAIGDLPFNQIAGLINAIDVPVIDHQTLTQIVNAIGQFPFTRVESLMKNVGNYVTQVIED